MNDAEGALSVGRLIRAIGYALQGLGDAVRHEAAFRLELLGCVVAIPLGIWIGSSGVERALLVGSVLLVPLVELINSAIEAAVDRIGPERHPLSKRAKDLGAAAVMVSVFNAVMMWLIVSLD